MATIFAILGLLAARFLGLSLGRTFGEGSGLTLAGSAGSVEVGFGLVEFSLQAFVLAAKQIVYDSGRQLLYAAVGNADATHPNTVAIIDPSSATVTTTIPVGADPHRLRAEHRTFRHLSRCGPVLFAGSHPPAAGAAADRTR